MSVKSVKVNDFETSIGRYFNDIKSYKPLTKKEEKSLWARYKEGHDMSARNELIKANLKFVSDEAKKYKGCGLPYADIISEGNEGLVKAIDRFDPSKDNKVISYAVWWIRKSILEAIEKRGVIEAEEYDSSESYNDPEKENSDTPEEKTGSFNLNEYLFGESMNKAPSTENKIQMIEELFDGISERDKYIVSDYFGLNGVKPKTLDEIGEELSLTKERVRQLNEKALKRMRTNALEKNITFF